MEPNEMDVLRELEAARKDIEAMEAICRVLGEALEKLVDALHALDVPGDSDVDRPLLA